MLGAQAAKAPAKAPAAKSAATTKAAAPAPTFNKALLDPAKLAAKAPAEFDVTFVTTKGDFTVHVTREWSPLGADRFYTLAKNHFFDGVAFFRNIPGFMVQFGMHPYPEVTAAWKAFNIKDEPVKQHNTPGFLTFAKCGAPDCRGTQLFINYGDNSTNLDGQGFSPIGKVTEGGMEIVKQLYSGYGAAPGEDQPQITAEGKKFLEKKYPNLDTIKTTKISGVPATAGKAPASKAPASKAPASKAPAKKTDDKK